MVKSTVGEHPIVRASFAAYCTACENVMIARLMPPMFAAAGYSVIYLFEGGGPFGAIVIFIIAHKCWENEFRQRNSSIPNYKTQP
ncbi:MAG: hypothetical protein ABSA83_18275 [Verrucomicrobiota bacterium]|jgi:hypothetical protein